MMRFDVGTDWKCTSRSTWRGELTPEWTQGRTAFGGYIVAGAVRALDTFVGAGQRLRTVSSALMESIELGAFDAEATLLRRGRNVTVVEMRITQNGNLCTHIVATYASSRDSKIRVDGAPPHIERPAPDGLPVMPYIEGLMPPCTQHFNRRWTEGDIPFSGSKLSHISGWIQLPAAGTHIDSIAIALLDAFPFPELQMLNERKPVTSIHWTAHLFDLDGADPTGWWWVASKTVHAGGGYSTFATRLYRSDGKLGAWAEQLIGIYD